MNGVAEYLPTEVVPRVLRICGMNQSPLPKVDSSPSALGEHGEDIQTLKKFSEYLNTISHQLRHLLSWLLAHLI